MKRWIPWFVFSQTFESYKFFLKIMLAESGYEQENMAFTIVNNLTISYLIKQELKTF